MLSKLLIIVVFCAIGNVNTAWGNSLSELPQNRFMHQQENSVLTNKAVSYKDKNIFAASKFLKPKGKIVCFVLFPPGIVFCYVEVELGGDSATRQIQSPATFDGKNLILTNPKSNGDKRQNLLVVEEDIELDETTSRVLGYKKVTVLAGKYQMSAGKEIVLKANSTEKLECERFKP